MLCKKQKIIEHFEQNINHLHYQTNKNINLLLSYFYFQKIFFSFNYAFSPFIKFHKAINSKHLQCQNIFDF